ncbi:MAG: Ig-like domain-containing protein [Clostridiales bacterium]|nr:Ig-like domain-containing protein [Clostridiales bacterium]
MKKRTISLVICVWVLLFVSWAFAEGEARLVLNNTEVSVAVGKSVQLKTTVENRSAKKAKAAWESSDPAVCTVSSSGSVKGVSEGSATITCTMTFPEGDTLSAECLVSVVVPVKKVQAVNGSVRLKAGETAAAEYTISPENATVKSLSWSSADESVASVDGDGLITGVSAGSTKVTGTTKDGSKAKVVYTVSVSSLAFEETEYTIREISGLTIPFSYGGSAFDKNVSVKVSGKPLGYSLRCEGNRAELHLDAREAGDSTVVITDKKDPKAAVELTVHTEESAIPDNMLLEFTSVTFQNKKGGMEILFSGLNHSSKRITKVTCIIDFRKKNGEQKFYTYQYDVYDVPCPISYWTWSWYINPGEKSTYSLLPAIDFNNTTIKDKSIAELRCAVSRIFFEDGTVVYIPEGAAYWFSTKTGYLDRPEVTENYTAPSKAVQDISDSYDFGLVTSDVADFARTWYKSSVTGGFVARVEPGSDADKCGFHLKDIVVEADGNVLSEDTFYLEKAYAKIAEGETVLFKVLRNGSDMIEIEGKRAEIPVSTDSSDSRGASGTGTITWAGDDAPETGDTVDVHSSAGDISFTFDSERTYFDLTYQYPSRIGFQQTVDQNGRDILRYYADEYGLSSDFGIVLSRKTGISPDRWLIDELGLDITKTEINGIVWSIGVSQTDKATIIVYACEIGEYTYSISFSTTSPKDFEFADFARAFIRRVVR